MFTIDLWISALTFWIFVDWPGSFQFDLEGFGEAMAEMKQETRSMSRLSHYACWWECIRRNGCYFVTSSYEPQLFGDPFKCHLYMPNSTAPTDPIKTCKRDSSALTELVKKVAGSCEDHKCRYGEICFVPDGKGYGCKSDSGRHGRRDKIRKSGKINK